MIPNLKIMDDIHIMDSIFQKITQIDRQTNKLTDYWTNREASNDKGSLKKDLFLVTGPLRGGG